MRTRGVWLAVFAVQWAVLGLMVCGVAEAQPFPRSVSFGTPQPGTESYTVGTAIAKIVSAAAPFQVVVQPYSGTSTYLPLLNSGELEFGTANSQMMGLAYQGPARLKVGGRNPFPHSPNIRLVMRGSPLVVGLLVLRNSPIKTIQEIRGKRLSGEYPAHLASWYVGFGALANAGMTWSDVRVVPVASVNDGPDALAQGRVDVSHHALNSAKVREVDATVGVRHLSLDCSPEGKERLQKAVPGFYPRLVKAGSATAVVEDTCVVAFDNYMLTHKAFPEPVVVAMLQAIWENVDKLRPYHPTFREWTRERAVDPGVTLPYHPGAIKFYRERGVWTRELDQAQERLLALNP